MKKWFFVVVITILIGSCSVEDDTVSYYNELVPVEHVEIPDTLAYHQQYTFSIFYKNPSTCHSFAGFDYVKDINERKIGVVTRVVDQSNCASLTEDNLISKPLNFHVERNDYYIFKFWQGLDENDEPIYLTKTVPVKIVQENKY